MKSARVLQQDGYLWAVGFVVSFIGSGALISVADWAARGHGWQAGVIDFVFTVFAGVAALFSLISAFQAYEHFQTARAMRADPDRFAN